METMEILIYISIAIISGGLLMGFLFGWDYMQGYKEMKEMMVDDDELKFKTADTIEFAGLLHVFFQECVATGENMSLVLYLQGNGSFSKAELFDYYKELGWCDTIQSLANSCGAREDLQMGTISIPKIVRVSCSDSILNIT